MSASKNLIQAAAGVGGDFYPYTVDYSARFNQADSSYMTWTPSGAGDSTQTFSFSFWFKRSDLGDRQFLFSWRTTSSDQVNLFINSDDTMKVYINDNSVVDELVTTQVFRDTSAFYHVVFEVDTTQATESDREKLWINGVRITDFSTEQYVPQNATLNVGNASRRDLFARGWNSDEYWGGYMSQVAYTDGTAYTASDFGEFKNGVWVPKDISGLTFGTNGFYLDFSNSAALGTDVSGNGNNFTTSGLTSLDQMIDTPTNNFWTFPTMVSRVGQTGTTASEGNLRFVTDNSEHNLGLGLPTSGKWYFEAQSQNCYPGNGYRGFIGVQDPVGNAESNCSPPGTY